MTKAHAHTISTCTWVDCDKQGVDAQLDKQGKQWAKLCSIHALMLNDALKSMDAKKMVAYWVKAQGGAKKAAKRMM